MTVTSITCQIPPSAFNYNIEIGSGILDRQAQYLRPLAYRFAIVSDDLVAPLYGERMLRSLSSAGINVDLFLFPHGERCKTRSIKENVENELFEKGFSRDSCVIALGGGVVTDLGGYLAATFCRGVPLVMAPTSLLAMVDASIGGKTGVNIPQGKNMVGCIYQPKKVIVDISTLQTLPQNELANGIVETIKHALIADSKLFEYLETYADDILALEPTILTNVIAASCLIKKTIVEQDEKENGKRRLLNCGHTVGHAIEQLMDYALPHGEAVALGILIECCIAWKMGFLDQQVIDRILSLFIKIGISLRLPSKVSPQSLMNTMTLDKKSLRGRPRFVMLDAIGSALSFDSAYCTYVEESLIAFAIDHVWNNLNAGIR